MNLLLGLAPLAPQVRKPLGREVPAPKLSVSDERKHLLSGLQGNLLGLKGNAQSLANFVAVVPVHDEVVPGEDLAIGGVKPLLLEVLLQDGIFFLLEGRVERRELGVNLKFY